MRHTRRGWSGCVGAGAVLKLQCSAALAREVAARQCQRAEETRGLPAPAGHGVPVLRLPRGVCNRRRGEAARLQERGFLLHRHPSRFVQPKVHFVCFYMSVNNEEFRVRTQRLHSTVSSQTPACDVFIAPHVCTGSNNKVTVATRFRSLSGSQRICTYLKTTTSATSFVAVIKVG